MHIKLTIWDAYEAKIWEKIQYHRKCGNIWDAYKTLKFGNTPYA